MAGQVEKARTKQQDLKARQKRLEKQLEKVLFEIERSRCAQARAQASVEALDATMGLVHSRVDPASAGIVDAWAGKYGKRGGLGEFIERVLHEAAPGHVTTTVLITLAVQNFDLVLASPRDRRNFRKSVGSALTSLLKRDLIEPLHDRLEGSHGVWRWKAASSSLDALRAYAEQAGRAVATPRTGA